MGGGGGGGQDGGNWEDRNLASPVGQHVRELVVHPELPLVVLRPLTVRLLLEKEREMAGAEAGAVREGRSGGRGGEGEGRSGGWEEWGGRGYPPRTG